MRLLSNILWLLPLLTVLPTAACSNGKVRVSPPSALPVCGNGVLEGEEQCDGDNLGGADCTTVGGGFAGGTLACVGPADAGECTLDTSGCHFCGNDGRDAGEACDGTDLAGQTCVTKGFMAGTLTCSALCDAFDTTACIPCDSPTLSLALSRDVATTPYAIDARATALNRCHRPATGLTVSVTADGATVGAVQDLGNGDYSAKLTPLAADREVTLTASATVDGVALSARKVALVLSEVGATWDQPEKVEGLVNTPGYEDGPEISPDGQWLIVSSYSPVDLPCCYLGCNGTTPMDPASPYCQTSVGPYAAPERPDFPGASRIVSSTQILNQCPSLCIASNPSALVPEGAYGFRRQGDGSFAQPFFIGVEADGCPLVCPYGFSVITVAPSGAGEVVFARSGGADNDVFWAPINFGVRNRLAVYSCEGGVPVRSSEIDVLLNLSPLGGTQGNPNLRGGYLWFDDDVPATNQLLVSTPTGTLPAASFSASQVVGEPVGIVKKRHQPFFDSPTLYFGYEPPGETSIASTDLAAGGDPANAAAWGAPRTELSVAPAALAAGLIIGVSEPSIAHLSSGGTELYFVYSKVTSLSGGSMAGTDLNVARVRRKP